MTDEFLQWLPEQPVAVSLDAATRWLRVDDLVRAEAEEQRAERARLALVRELLDRR